MKTLIKIGFSSNGDATFNVTSEIADLSLEQMNELRAMAVVALGTAEQVFRAASHDRHPVGNNVKKGA